MPYSRQRKAAKQVMQNLGDGTPRKGGPGKEVLGQIYIDDIFTSPALHRLRFGKLNCPLCSS